MRILCIAASHPVWEVRVKISRATIQTQTNNEHFRVSDIPSDEPERNPPTKSTHPSHSLPPHPHTQTMTIFGPLGPSLAGYIRSSKTLSSWLKPVSLWYASLAGYRRMGLKYDDLRTSSFVFPLCDVGGVIWFTDISFWFCSGRGTRRRSEGLHI